jgi:hypothetical protein
MRLSFTNEKMEKKGNRKCKAANTPLKLYDERALDFR